MSSMDNFPEISFIDNETLESVQLQLINDFQDRYEELTEESIELSSSDPSRLILYACAAQIYQSMLFVDNAGKQNFLKYAYEDYLDNLGAWKGVTRSAGKAATVQVKFTLSEIRTSAVTIPAGTRITAGDNVYFATDATVEIIAGNTHIETNATCSSIGTSSNGYEIGKINTLVDPIAYVESISNTTASSGGEDAETDENLIERIFLAPSGYSVAGSDEAYIYWAKTCNTKISDVKVTSQSDATVNITFLADSSIPDSSMIEELQAFLADKKIRPLTDHVVVAAPQTVDYEINVSYYIAESDRSIATTIQSQVTDAVASYITWQKEKIGRDINPSCLSKLICDAGAKRCVITLPVFTQITDTGIANLTAQNIEYGGIESD